MRQRVVKCSIRTFCLAVFSMTAIPSIAAVPESVTVRDTVSLNFGWLFQRGDSVFSDKAEKVDLPHDFQISQPWVEPTADERPNLSDASAYTKSRLSARGFKEMGIGWYKKTLRPMSSWRGKRIVLDFGGIMLTGDVYLNGQRIGGTDYGYVGFGLDITDKILWDKDNILLVKADTQKPDNSRWYTGGGLYRSVRLITMPHDNYFVRHPLRINTALDGSVAVEVEAYIKDRTQPFALIGLSILDSSGREVASCVNKFDKDRRRQRIFQLDTLHVQQPHLWSCESPYLYTAVATLLSADGTVVDVASENFGIRTLDYSPDYGFKLNGKKVLLKGIANHHTLGALGAAAYPRAIEKRIQLLKEFGFNHIRTSHNPYSDDLYELADKYGMLVVDELYDKWLKQYAGGKTEWTALWQNDIPEWVSAHRNHPSVIMWSLGNELQKYANLPFGDYGVTPFRLQRELLRHYDTSRPVTVAMHPQGRAFETDSIPCTLARITDIQAYNYRYMYFPGDAKRFPYMNFYQSEANLQMMGTNFYGMNLNKVIGLAYWGMIDYIGESRGWPAKGWTDGVFDISLQPKPRAWLLKSMFSDAPTVHIAIVNQASDGSEWNGVKMNDMQQTDVWMLESGCKYTIFTYTNADEVELLLNGKSLGTKKNNKNDVACRNRIRWDNIAYEKGTLEAVARIGNKIVARHKIETPSSAVALRLEPDNTEWSADGMDLQHIRVRAVDSKGRTDASCNLQAMFRVEGDARIVAVDNGDMQNHEINTIPRIHLHNGTALVILRAGPNAGKVRFSAEVQGMKKAVSLVMR